MRVEQGTIGLRKENAGFLIVISRFFVTKWYHFSKSLIFQATLMMFFRYGFLVGTHIVKENKTI
jgi:hypothetical protein